MCIRWRHACPGIGVRTRFEYAVHPTHAYIRIHPRACSGKYAAVTKRKPYLEYPTVFLLLADGPYSVVYVACRPHGRVTMGRIGFLF